MYIHRIILRDVRNFKHLDLTLENEWRQEPLKSVLITGPNGSGKSTLLRVIAALWETAQYWIQNKPLKAKLPFELPRILQFEGLAAIEIIDFTEKPIWIVKVGKKRQYLEEFYNFISPESMVIGGVHASNNYPNEYSEVKIQAPTKEWFQTINHQKDLLQVGASHATLLPNMLFIDAENRRLPEPIPTPLFTENLYHWLVTYADTDQMGGHIETMLKNLQLRNNELFQQTLEKINGFFGKNKKIVGLDSSLRFMVQVNGNRHYIEDLSSGEKQCLIMMFMVSRWLMPGGIVLIDEPDLHLHVGLQRHFVYELEKIVVVDKGGQLIVTSHSPTVWEEYSNRQSFDLGRVNA